jgi:hypothetical protein
VSYRDQYAKEYLDFMETWGPHCGAPKAVFKGHIDKLIATHKQYVAGTCSTRAFIHSQYPISTDYDRGYDAGRKAAADAINLDFDLFAGKKPEIKP